MVLPRHGHVLIDIKLILSINVFKYTPLAVSGPKNTIFFQTGTESQKIENWRFHFRYSFQTRLNSINHIFDQF